jgi:hypothetical protein
VRWITWSVDGKTDGVRTEPDFAHFFLANRSGLQIISVSGRSGEETHLLDHVVQGHVHVGGAHGETTESEAVESHRVVA